MLDQPEAERGINEIESQETIQQYGKMREEAAEKKVAYDSALPAVMTIDSTVKAFLASLRSALSAGTITPEASLTAASNPDNDFKSIDGVEDAPAKGAATGQTPGAT